jgi:hypothetical protein
MKVHGPPGWGSIESETGKYGHESGRTPMQEWLRWKGRSIFSSKCAPHIYKSVSDITKIWVGALAGAWYQDRLAEWPSSQHNYDIVQENKNSQTSRRDLSEEWLCWRGPAAIQTTDQLTEQKELWVRCEIVASQHIQKPLNTEPDESTWLRAVTKQRLLKTNWENVVHAIGYCKVCRLTLAL